MEIQAKEGHVEARYRSVRARLLGTAIALGLFFTAIILLGLTS